MSDYPFQEEKINDYYVRTFSADIDIKELQWHTDAEDRVVVPLNETNWLFQRDNCLPEPIYGKIKIAANEWHRVIKGNGELIVKVYKNEL